MIISDDDLVLSGVFTMSLTLLWLDYAESDTRMLVYAADGLYNTQQMLLP